MNIIILDTETTGLNPLEHSIIQLSAEFHSEGKVISKFNRRIKQPNSNVDLGALKVNGVALSDLSSYGELDEQRAVFEFIDWLLEINKSYKDINLLGHNVAGFDVQFIKQAMRNSKCSNIDAVLPYKVLDTASYALLLKASGLLPSDCKTNLESLAKQLGVSVVGKLHDSAVDVELTGKVFYAMIDLLKGNYVKNLKNAMLPPMVGPFVANDLTKLSVSGSGPDGLFQVTGTE